MYSLNVDELIKLALFEDAPFGDITTKALSIKGKGKGYFVAKEDFILCGIDIANRVFFQVDSKTIFTTKFKDGSFIKNGIKFAFVEGKLESLLLAERTSLNFLQRLSAIATKTFRAVKILRGTKTHLLDTRKTTPLLRQLEKYAVAVGGGRNHRMGLSDAILIKDNHISSVGNIKFAVKKARASFPLKKIEVEVKNLNEYEEAIRSKPDIIMLDNFSIEDIKTAVRMKPNGILLEASGGIYLENLSLYAKTGVDFISMGSLTHTVKATDISFKIEKV